MSLTNPKKIVTEERLSEFYNAILPYLGGMPDLMANKFNRSDLYSTDEKIVGRWIDGKPLYQKSFNIGALGASTKSYVTDLPDTYDVINQWGFYTNGNNAYALGYFDPRNLSWRATIATYKANSKININILVDTDWTGYTAYVTLQYTKQSDSATSIGIDTDYSTTEKIVGTWVDGSPIFQITVPVSGDYTSTGTWMTLFAAPTGASGIINGCIFLGSGVIYPTLAVIGGYVKLNCPSQIGGMFNCTIQYLKSTN